MTDFVRYERRGNAVWLTLNRPDKRNPLSREMVGALQEGIDRATGESGARAIVVAGEGRVFCAGADIQQYRDAGDREQVLADGGLLFDLIESMLASPLPVIARVQRAAFGGAVGLVCGADLVVAANDATFSLSEARLGLVPAVISRSVLLALGHRTARALMMLSEPFDAHHAKEIGLVHKVAPEADLDSVIDRWLGQITAGAPGALADAKALIRDINAAMSVEEVRSRAIELAADRRADPEGQEGLLAFMEKRKPSWSTE